MTSMIARAMAPQSMKLDTPMVGVWTHSSELWRVISGVSFMGMIAFGAILTLFFCTDCPDNMENTILYKHYGYNNACVFLDFAPAIYFMPTLWAFVMVSWIWAIYVQSTRAKAYAAHGQISNPWLACFVDVTFYLETFALMFFSTCLAIHPYSDWELILHTLPFTLLMQTANFTTCVQAIVGFASGYWARLGLISGKVWSSKFTWACIIFLTSSTIIFLLKGMYELERMFSDESPMPLQARFGQALDLLAWPGAFIPVLFNTYLVFFKRVKLEGIILVGAVPLESVVSAC